MTLAAFTAIPAGTPVTGRIVETKAAGRLAGAAVLGVELVSVRLPNGTEAPQDVSLVTQELANKGQGRGTNTAQKTGGRAAFGAIVGGLAGGGAGAGIGAASGGALGLGANALTHGKDIDLKPEQLLQFHPFARLRQFHGPAQPQILPSLDNLCEHPPPSGMNFAAVCAGASLRSCSINRTADFTTFCAFSAFWCNAATISLLFGSSLHKADL